MILSYILDEGGSPVPCDDVVKFSEWFSTADRCVARDECDGVTISTVFLGIDHDWGSGPPILYETMIFGIGGEEYQARCSTREQALLQHIQALRYARSFLVEEKTNGEEYVPTVSLPPSFRKLGIGDE